MSNSSHTFAQFLCAKFTCLSSSSSGDEQRVRNKRRKCRTLKYTSFEQLPNELLLELFDYFTLFDIYTIFYGLNTRFNQLIAFSCIRGFAIHSIRENNLYLKCILPDIPPWQINTLKLWHNSSYEQLLNKFPINLYYVHTLILKRLKNLSFHQCRELLKHFKCLETLSMIDFHTAKVDWLDDNNWKNLIDIDLPHLRYLDVRISVIYHKQIYDDDKDNIIYSFTSRYGRPTYRLYTGSLLKRDPILEICLTIDQVFPLR
ncbi:unnamed protein product [Rotaria sordida]|uniref:F-box domain-containing protein n=1 Tax=Rotaria sordida TaxID=392033 RepID=A0A814D323_9BILA|nr:unnamed protein product [Rotaria sordida]CAF0949595.1 unnamed protein product [Rotaria sordida]